MTIFNSHRLMTTGLLLSALVAGGCDNQASNAIEGLNVTGASVANGDMIVTGSELSDRIIKQLNDYVLYDIRNIGEFEKGHIKTAQQARVAQLLADEENPASGKDIILYSEQSDKAAQLATLLRVKGTNAFFLSGVYRQCQQHIKNADGNPSSKDEAQ